MAARYNSHDAQQTERGDEMLNEENTEESPEGAARRFASRLEAINHHIDRYFVAVHGKDYHYRAPETFDNVLERWMLHILRGDSELASEAINKIEEMATRWN